MKAAVALALFLFIGCATVAPRKPASDNPNQIRTAQNRSASEIAVYIGDAEIQFWAAPDSTFRIASESDKADLDKLKAYLFSKMAELGGPTNGAAELQLASVLTRETRTVVRFNEVIVRHNNDKFNYAVPVSGAQLVINLNDGRVTSISSSLQQPPSFSFAFKQSGFDTSDFSENEYSVLLNYVRHSDNKKQITDRLSRLAREVGKTFDLDAFSRKPVATQRAELSDLLSHLSPLATARLMIELAMKQRLSYVQRDGHWMLMVSRLFELPVEFDMEIPESKAQLKVRNLRELHQRVTVNIWDGKNFPITPQPPFQSINSDNGQPSANDGAQTAKLFAHAINYFKRYHNWLNYAGKDPNGRLDIYINMVDPAVIDNAAWVQDKKIVVIGTGSQILKDQKNSDSILGHEFTHAIVWASSGLVYEGESGGLNEHFADIEGSYIAGDANGKVFTYEIGSDALKPEVAAPRQLLVALLIAGLKAGGQNVDPAEIAKYSLDKVPVRHLRYPTLSLTPSINDMPTAVKTFGTACQPSVDNDHCGVHSLSGVPNRAVAEIVDVLGPARAREMIFNTVVMRLNAHSTFKDYVRQMYEECLVTPGLNREVDCPVIIQAFNEVGVTYPAQTPAPPPAAKPGPPPKRDDTPVPNPNQPQPTPTLDLCGVIKRLPSGNATVVDNKINASIVIAKFPKVTQGNFQEIFGFQCACARGHISQMQNSKGVWFNYFTDIASVWQRPSAACDSIHADD